MAIARDADTSDETIGTSTTYAHTCTGSNLYLVGGAYVATAGDLVIDMTYNAVTMVEQSEAIFAGAGPWIKVFGLHNPATGANNVVVTATESGSIRSNVSSYTGVNQNTTPDNTGVILVETGASPLTLSITSVADNCWMVAYAWGWSFAPTASTGFNAFETSPIVGGDSNAPITPAGSNSMSTTFGGTDYQCIVGITISPPLPAGPAKLKTWDTVLAAKVKTRDTALIAKIKTADTVV